MLTNFLIRFYVSIIYVLLVASLATLLFAYDNIQVGFSRFAFLTIYIIICVLYLYLYRRENLFCFDIFFFIFYIISVFFSDIVLSNLLDMSTVSSVMFQSFAQKTANKGLIVSSMALLAYIAGGLKTETMKPFYINKKLYRNDNGLINKFSSNIFSIFITIYIVYLFYNQTIASWFHYSGTAIYEYNNSAIMFLTSGFLALTALEFLRLKSLGCNSLSSVFKKINKIYFIDICIISTLLLTSGNRNECLLILLPPIVAYSLFIHKISNKQFLIGLGVGITLMVVVGVTRQSGVFSGVDRSDISLYEMTRDFGYVDNNTTYLVEYTDNHKPIYFKNAFVNLTSSVPFLGGIAVNAFGIIMDDRSTSLTTDGMQSKNNMDSGLGTSLAGDLYYTGTWIFVFLFMFFLGWIVAYLNRIFSTERCDNIWLLVIYLFLFANVVYFIRAEWTMPFRYIGFAFTVLLIVRIFSFKAN